MIAWRRDIHRHPELGNRELLTARLVAEHLRSLGLAVKTGVAHTGVTAVLTGGKPGPTIALRADMDALPVVEQVDVPFRQRTLPMTRGRCRRRGDPARTRGRPGCPQSFTAVRHRRAGARGGDARPARRHRRLHARPLSRMRAVEPARVRASGRPM